MGIFRRKVPAHFIPVHRDNIGKKDWIILLEAGTIVGRNQAKLRVALATTQKKIVRKYNILFQGKHFLVLDGYDARIHALYFCPQLYRRDADNKLVPIDGEEIGNLLAMSLQDGVLEKNPWYEPSTKLPNEPVISRSMKPDFDTVVVDIPASTRLEAAE